jgi:type II secretory pathway component GspD/PulD (secretin)
VLLLTPALLSQPACAQDPASNQANLNFVGADIEAVVRAIGHYTGNTFVIDPRVKGTINLVSEKPVSKMQALEMLSSVLRLQGFSVVNTPDYVKVVPEAEAKLQAGPVLAEKERGRGDQIVTRVFHLNHESASGLITVLRPLIAANNAIAADPTNNTLIITDYADNIKRLARIITAVDTPASGELDVVKTIAVHITHVLCALVFVRHAYLVTAVHRKALAQAGQFVQWKVVVPVDHQRRSQRRVATGRAGDRCRHRHIAKGLAFQLGLGDREIHIPVGDVGGAHGGRQGLVSPKQRHRVTRFTSELLNDDLVSGGDAVLLAASAHDCEHGYQSLLL